MNAASVRPNGLRHAHFAGGAARRFLRHRPVYMMPPAPPEPRVGRNRRSGEDPLPTPLPIRVRILRRQGVRQQHAAVSVLQVGLVKPSHSRQMLGQGLLQRSRQHRYPALATSSARASRACRISASPNLIRDNRIEARRAGLAPPRSDAQPPGVGAAQEDSAPPLGRTAGAGGDRLSWLSGEDKQPGALPCRGNSRCSWVACFENRAHQLAAAVARIEVALGQAVGGRRTFYPIGQVAFVNGEEPARLVVHGAHGRNLDDPGMVDVERSTHSLPHVPVLTQPSRGSCDGQHDIQM